MLYNLMGRVNDMQSLTNYAALVYVVVLAPSASIGSALGSCDWIEAFLFFTCHEDLTSHFYVLLLSADLQDGVQLLLCVRLRGDDQQPVQQVYGDAMRRPAPC